MLDLIVSFRLNAGSWIGAIRRLDYSLKLPCRGVDHMDFSANGRYLIASCEFSGDMVKVDVAERKLIGTLPIRKGGMPQDVKTSPVID